MVLFLPFWVLKGKAYLKEQLAVRVQPNPATLPFNEEVVAYCRNRAQQGDEVFLATGSHRSLAGLVADHLGFFMGVIATEGRFNAVGLNKLEQIRLRLGEVPFDYVGDSLKDLPLWREASHAVLVDVPEKLRRQVEEHTPVLAEFRVPKGSIHTYGKALRLHHWVKNVLVVVPLFTAHGYLEAVALVRSLAAFLAFGLMASAVYVINDLLDLEADRQHPKKRERPFASGRLPLVVGIFSVPLLLAASLAIASSLPVAFSLLLGMYFVVALTYSLYLKPILIIDVITLAGLFTLRLFSGAHAVQVPLSPWLLAFSMFFFLSLAFAKRYAELFQWHGSGRRQSPGRGYRLEDLESVSLFGVCSGIMAVLVLALYVNSGAVTKIYSHPEGLWFLCPLLFYWVTRIWFITKRGKMDGDPIVFAFRDKVSYLTGCLILVIVVASL